MDAPFLYIRYPAFLGQTWRSRNLGTILIRIAQVPCDLHGKSFKQ